MIYVCSQYRGDVDANVALARKACKYELMCGNAPFAPHLLYTQMLDDSKDDERSAGIAAGCEVLLKCSELHVFRTFKDDQFSPISVGMAHEIAWAEHNNIPVEYYYTVDGGDEWWPM